MRTVAIEINDAGIAVADSSGLLAIEPGYAGIRAKIAPKGTQATDFVIQGPREHSVPGLVNLFAIESPGLTASLALAQEVAGVLGEPVSRAA